MARTRQTRVKKAKMPETPCSPTPGDLRFSRETPEKLLLEILPLSPSDYIKKLAKAAFNAARKCTKFPQDMNREKIMMHMEALAQAAKRAKERRNIQAELNSMAAFPSMPALSAENVTVNVSSRVSGRTAGDETCA